MESTHSGERDREPGGHGGQRSADGLSSRRVDLPLKGMSCASCAATIAAALAKAGGVTSASVNFATKTATVAVTVDATNGLTGTFGPFQINV